MPNKHAYFSPSASSRWIPCPPSLFLSEQHQSQTSSYAHEGIVCHDVAATCLTKNVVASSYAGQVVDGVSMTPELIDAIQMYVDEVRGLVKEFKAEGGKIEHEVKLTEDCWGTSDTVLWNQEVLIIIDLKMGKGVVVSAEDNSQLKLYSVGGARWLFENYGFKPQRIINIIIQPRTVNPIRRYELTRDELASWFKNEVLPVLNSHKPGVKSSLECNPGEAQCRWCKVSATCVAQASKTMNDAQAAFAPFSKVEAPKIATSKDAIMTIEIAAEYKKSFIHITKWMKTIEEFLFERAMAGDPVPGFKLVLGKSNRKWGADEKQVAKFLFDLKYDPYIKKLISPTQAEKSMGKKEAKKHNLDQFITKPPGKPTLVPQSDTRPEMGKNVEEEFQEFVPDSSVILVHKNDSSVILVDNASDTEEKTVVRLTALQRMQMGEIEDEIEVPDELLKGVDVLEEASGISVLEEATRTATGGNPADVEVVESVGSIKSSMPPKSTTKRYQVLNFGKGGVTLKDAAQALGCGENMIKMHLRYLNERDGYSYEIYSDDTFKVF